ncbi:chorismate mutase [Microbispora sp. H10836]|uniref:chorismate mutase n=1 Tax=Microbispora sp. H10836 TaxID=2729106 RepID=UPI001472BEE6|nr:chorismate mutase [Microbispora sp. H10836]
MTKAAQLDRDAVRIGDLVIGDGLPVVVVGGQDARWLRLRGDGGPPGDGTVAEARASWAGPLLVEPASVADLPTVARHADGVVVGAAWACDPGLVRAAARLGLPVVLQRGVVGGRTATLEEWLTAVDDCAAEDNEAIVLCESGGRAEPEDAAPDLGLMRAARERTGRPVLAGLGGDGALADAAVAAGADGLLVGPGAPVRALAAAHEAATVVAAILRPEVPETLDAARGAIDRVDAALATLLERRAGLAGRIQRLKPVGGFRGRDMERERRLVTAMARRAPSLGAGLLAPIMNAVIEAGLRLSEETRDGEERR